MWFIFLFYKHGMLIPKVLVNVHRKYFNVVSVYKIPFLQNCVFTFFTFFAAKCALISDISDRIITNHKVPSHFGDSLVQTDT